MIQLNKLSEDGIQVLGSYEGISIRGIAFRVIVPGNLSRVWHYNLTLMRAPIKMVLVSNEKEGTMTREELLLERIERSCKEFLEEYTTRIPIKGCQS